MSFEERFAAIGRAIDGASESLRRGTSKSRFSEGASSLKDAVSTKVTDAYERSKSAVAEGRSRMRDQESRGRVMVVFLVVASIAVTAVITRNLVGGGGVTVRDAVDADRMSSLAAARDAKNMPGAAAPTPVKSVRARSQTTPR